MPPVAASIGAAGSALGQADSTSGGGGGGGITVKVPFSGNGTVGSPLIEGPDTTVVLGADGPSITLTGLNSETDGDYEAWGEVITSAAGTLTVQPGGITANQIGGQTVSTSTTLIVITNTGAARKIRFFFRLTSKTGNNRMFWSQSLNAAPDDSVASANDVSFAVWKDKVTTFNNVVIHQSAGNMLAGSWVRIKKLGRTF